MKSRTGMLQGSAIALVASMVLGSSAMGAVPASCPSVEVASVVSPGLPTSRLFPGPNRESITVEKVSIITARDVIKADASHAEGSWGLGLRLSPEAATRMRSYTTAHVGDQLAFIVQGRAKMVVKILDPISGDGVWVSPFERQEAESLAVSINACAAKVR
jgi:preprotein translocase subunit SecD